MQLRKTSIALAAMTLCGAAQAAPTGLSFRAPANNATISGNIYQSSACELTGSGIARVDFYLGSTLLNREGSAPWNCNIDTRKFSDGAYALRAVAYDSGGAAASTQISVNIKNNTSSTPYSGTPIALPKAFAAVDFDKGGQGVAYRDLTTGNAGGQYRKSEDVDIVAVSGSPLSPYTVNGFQTGEWLAYTVNVPATGRYDIAVNASSSYAATSAFRVEVDGVDVTGKVDVPNTGSWSTFKWVGKQGVSLAAGKRVLKVVSAAEYFNLNGVSVLASAVTAPSTSAPLVSFSAPKNGQTVSKTLSGSACEALVANGTTAIKGVQFFVDGVLLNTEGSAPWNCSFDTTKVKDGARVLRAVATDVNGKTGSSEISVTVANGTSGGTTSGNGPTNVVFAAPKSGATISSDIYQSSACELTGTGISRVEFFLSGKALNTEGGAPWNCNIAVKDHASGTHKLKAIAYNSSGGSTVAEVDVNIQNGSGGSTTSPTSPSSGTPSFSCSFESSPTDCGFTEQAKEPGRATLVSSAREGIRGVRLYTASGDNNVSGSGTWERNDLRLTQAATDCSEGKVQWWGHSILFPSDYNLPNNGGVVMDFHHTGSSGQANFHVDAMSTGLRLRGYGGATVDSGRYQVELGPVVRNVWYDFVYHVKWSSGSDGYMHAWVNGVKKLTHYGPTLYAGMGCYLKLANYHDPMGKSSAVIHDRVRRGSKAEDVSLTPLP